MKVVTIENDLVELMKEAIIGSKDKRGSPFYWLSQLDYSRETSHPEYQVLSDKVEVDLKVIMEAKYLIEQYEEIGFSELRDYLTRGNR